MVAVQLFIRTIRKDMLIHSKSRSLVIFLLLMGLLAAYVGIEQLIITKMPGRSFEGTLENLTPEQIVLKGRLRQHVETLATDIGERNLLR